MWVELYIKIQYYQFGMATIITAQIRDRMRRCNLGIKLRGL